jgi:hypothetical protein
MWQLASPLPSPTPGVGEAFVHWLVSGFTSYNALSLLVSAVAAFVAWRAYVRSRPAPPEQPIIRTSTEWAGEAPIPVTVNKTDGTPVHVMYRSTLVVVTNAGPVAAHDVNLHLSRTKYGNSASWRLGKLEPDAHPKTNVQLVTSDDDEDPEPPTVWVTWTEFPGNVPRRLHVEVD